MTDAGPDIRAAVQEIVAEAHRRRSSGELSAALLQRLDAPFDPAPELDAPEEFAVLQSARPLHSGRRRLGAHVVRTKRVVRRLLAWYIQPIAEDQTRFNLAILRQLRELEQRVRWLEPPLWSVSSGGASYAPSHARRLADLLPDARGLRVLGGDQSLRDRLSDAGVAGVSAISWDELASAALASLPAVMFADCLDRMTAAQVLAALPLAVASVEMGGWVIVDAVHREGVHGSDIGVVRRLEAGHLTALMRDAGLDDVEVLDGQARLVVSGRRRGG